MKVIKTVSSVGKVIKAMRSSGFRIGLVPTMGSLHEGHLSLVRLARESADKVIVSIFVNPLQFSSNEDFGQYPRNLDHDMQCASEAGADIVFAPSTKDFYTDNFSTYLTFKTPIANKLEGQFRPDHFNGVLTVVLKLLNITQADMAFFGQKDAQQLWSIRKMVNNLNLDVKIIDAPTVREKDGLAMSSRNIYLKTKEERSQSLAIFKSLKACCDAVKKGERSAKAIEILASEKIAGYSMATLQYASVVDAETFTEVARILNPKKALLLIAVRFPSVRLIDNCFLNGKNL